MDKAYKYFLQVVESGSISAAAEKLRVSQPALSFSLKSLESELEVELLVRSRRGVQLTDEGKVVYEKLLALKSAEKNLHDSLAESVGKNNGLNIGAIDSIALSIIAEFEVDSDQASILVDNTAELINKVQNGLLDVAYITKPSKEASGLAYKTIGMEEMVLVGKKEPEGKSFSLLAYNQSSNTYRHINEALVASGLQPKPVFHSTDPHLLLEAARLGKGVTVIPKQLHEKVNDTGVIRVYKNISVYRPIVRVARQDRWLSSALNTYEKSIISYLV